mmetsp:Transcript_71743/g.207843  ORF Transcript_71743/g.207843 Transcript_71743/m.207843 type:complete len:219 (-) Transcript_71743:1276-1932(-)
MDSRDVLIKYARSSMSTAATEARCLCDRWCQSTPQNRTATKAPRAGGAEVALVVGEVDAPAGAVVDGEVDASELLVSSSASQKLDHSPPGIGNGASTRQDARGRMSTSKSMPAAAKAAWAVSAVTCAVTSASSAASRVRFAAEARPDAMAKSKSTLEVATGLVRTMSKSRAAASEPAARGTHAKRLRGKPPPADDDMPDAQPSRPLASAMASAETPAA